MADLARQSAVRAPAALNRATAGRALGSDGRPKDRPRSGGRKRGIGPATTPEQWAHHDSRSAEGKLLATVRRQLAEHIGGKPTVTQRLMIDRAAWLVVHISKLDAKALKNGGMSDHCSREYLAFCNSLRRVLGELGMKARSQDQHDDDLAALLGRP